jgi:ketosteroid isomerase-like protein
MSQENVEIVEAIYAEWAERRLGREFMAEDIRYVNPPYALEGGTREGADSFNNVFEVYSELRFEIDRLIDAGKEKVVMVGTMEGVARQTGLEMTRPHSQVWTIRDGKAISMQWFHAESEALEAAGLSE